MREKPRKKDENMFSNGGLACTLCYGMVIGVISLLAFLTIPYQELLSRELPVTLMNLKKILQIDGILNIAQTHAFTVLGMSQLVHAVGMRDVNKSVFKMNHLENRYMLVAWGLGIMLQVLVTEVPYFITLFKTSRLGMEEWGILGVLSCLPLIIHELLILSQKLLDMGREKETKDEWQNPSDEAQQGQQHQNGSTQPGEVL